MTVGESRGEGRNQRRAKVEGGEPEPPGAKHLLESRRQRQRLAQPLPIRQRFRGCGHGHHFWSAHKDAGGTRFRMGLVEMVTAGWGAAFLARVSLRCRVPAGPVPEKAARVAPIEEIADGIT